MSIPGTVRRTDRLMSHDAIGAFLEGSRYGRLATIGDDGYPYCVPLLYIVSDGEIFVHNTSARGHLRSNVERHPQVCFEIDEAGSVFDYGRFECDSSIAYRSVVVFGRIRIVEERAAKQSFCDALMQKYGNPANGRPKGFYPRLDQITVYAITIERMTGKELALPDESERWPVKDNTRTPNASPD